MQFPVLLFPDISVKRQSCQKTELSKDRAVKRQSCQKTELSKDRAVKRQSCQKTELSKDRAVKGFPSKLNLTVPASMKACMFLC